jgi:nucleoid-associated protein YgaU
LGLKDPAARTARPEQFVDLSIVKELDSNGFIDRVYKAPASPPPVATPAPSKEKTPVQLAETKIKPVAAAEEKPKPVAKQIPTASVKAPGAAPAAKAAAQQYVVKAGDTLSKIAGQFYNSIGKWEKIYEANKDSLKNPNYIYVGMKLVIPADG